jgi:ribosomal protein S18 acetylase RimI-like enzyme
MEIVSFDQIDCDIQEKTISQIKDIFFSCSSVKNFRDENHQSSFFNKWCGDYLSKSPMHFYIALEEESVVGYLSGSLDSIEALDNFIIPGPEVFKDCFEKFPAHFHINCAPNHQGKGIGRKLVDHYVQQLSKTSINGVHLITSTDADNLGFYRALGFTSEVLRPFNSHELLLMGKEISA